MNPCPHYGSANINLATTNIIIVIYNNRCIHARVECGVWAANKRPYIYAARVFEWLIHLAHKIRFDTENISHIRTFAFRVQSHSLWHFTWVLNAHTYQANGRKYAKIETRNHFRWARNFRSIGRGDETTKFTVIRCVSDDTYKVPRTIYIIRGESEMREYSRWCENCAHSDL